MEVLISQLSALAIMILLVLCSAFFSGTETALFSLSPKQVSELRSSGGHIERLLHLLSQNPSGLLIAILFGNLVVNILFFSMGAVVALNLSEQYGEWWQAIVGVLALLLVILVGEILPKSIGILSPGKVATLNALPLLAWFHFLGPVRKVLEIVANWLEPEVQHDGRLNAEELRMLIEATHHDSTFGEQEKAIVEDIVNLPETRVREMMVPRVEQFFRSFDATVGDALREAAEREVELIPIYEGEEDNIIGVAEVRDLFVSTDLERRLSDFAQPVTFVPETKPADEMLRDFLSQKIKMVCVVNEYGGLAGTLCLDDLLQEVVGDYDATEVGPVEQLGETTYRLKGNLGIREWRSMFMGFLPEEVMRTLALDTLSGLVVSLLKRMPVVGDIVQVGNLKFTVEHVRARRIETVILELAKDGADS